MSLLDSLLASQADKAQSLASKRADNLVSGSVASGNGFAQEFNKVKDAYQSRADQANDLKADTAKTIDNYRKDAEQYISQRQAKLDQAKDDLRKASSNDYHDAKADNKASNKDASVTKSSNSNDAGAPDAKSAQNADNQVAPDKAAQKGEKPKDPTVKTVTPDGKVVDAAPVHEKGAEQLGVKEILNLAATGLAKGDVIEDPLAISAKEQLSRGQDILQGQQQAGALIVSQLHGHVEGTEAHQGEKQNAANGKVEAKAGVAQPLSFLQASLQEVGGEVASQALQSKGKTSAVNVARQSKELVKLQNAAVAEQGAKTEGDTKVNIADAQKGNVLLNQQDASAAGKQTKSDIIAALQDKLNIQRHDAAQQKADGSQQQGNSAGQQQNAQAAVNASGQQSANTGGQQHQHHQQQGRNADVALGKAQALQATDGDGAKENGAAKTDASQLLDSSKFKEYMKLSDVQAGGVAKAQTNTAPRAESVLAQIKFGVAAAAAKGDKTITIQLSPKELGTVDVHMKIHSDGRADVSVVAQRADTMSMLQREAHHLRDALNDALKNQETQLNFAFREESGGQQGQYDGQQTKGYGVSGIDESASGVSNLMETGSMLYEINMQMKQGVNLVI